MLNLTLRFPYLIYLSIAAMLVGVIIAPLFRDLPAQTSAAETMAQELQHGIVEVPAIGAPQLAIAVEKDMLDGWNLTISTENFSFSPAMVNGANIDNTGHAHLHVNGIKLARLYGPSFHIPDLPVGDHEISVTLSSNDHSYYHVDGNPIAARTTITQDDPDTETP